LLLEYGFFIPGNPSDFLEFSMNDINCYIKDHPELKFLVIPKHKYKFIRDHQLDQQITVDLIDGLSHNFQAVLAILLIPTNLYNLTQVAFGDALDFQDIRGFANELLKQKSSEYQKLSISLRNFKELSESGNVCANYFIECSKFIDRVLANFFE
jgi:hypothetical protein